MNVLSAPTLYQHIQINPDGLAYIAGTTMKVIELIEAHLVYGWSPEELHFQHPYLTMGQIYNALAYYWDHKERLDAEMTSRYEWSEKLRHDAPPSPVVAKLRQQGLLA